MGEVTKGSGACQMSMSTPSTLTPPSSPSKTVSVGNVTSLGRGRKRLRLREEDDPQRQIEVKKSVSFAHRIWRCLQANSDDCDIIFEIGEGPKKTIIPFSKLILKIACGDGFDVEAVQKIIGSSDVDPKMLRVFLKHIATDNVTADMLEMEKDIDRCGAEDLLNLNAICELFEVSNFELGLSQLIQPFYVNFEAFSQTDCFLELSPFNLKTMLSSEKLSITNEFIVYVGACKWVEARCSKLKVQFTGKNIRKELGDCLFLIRFPVMSNEDFGKVARGQIDILTAEENLLIYNYISMTPELKASYDAKATGLLFSTHERKGSLSLVTVSFLNSLTVDDLPFICDSTWHLNCFQISHPILLYAVNFLGPLNSNGLFEARVEIFLDPQNAPYSLGGTKRKFLFANKQEYLQLMFDKPILLQANWNENAWDAKTYGIRFSLKGPSTQSILMEKTIDGELDFQCEASEVKFSCRWSVGQLVQLLFKKL